MGVTKTLQVIVHAEPKGRKRERAVSLYSFQCFDVATAVTTLYNAGVGQRAKHLEDEKLLREHL